MIIGQQMKEEGVNYEFNYEWFLHFIFHLFLI